MELKIDKTTKILLGLIAFGLFLNASDTYITKAHAMPPDLVRDIVKQELVSFTNNNAIYRFKSLGGNYDAVWCKAPKGKKQCPEYVIRQPYR